MSTISLQQWALKSRVMNTVKDWKQKLRFCVLDRNIKILYSLKRKYVSMGIWFFIYMYTIILAGEMFLSKIWLLVFECLHLNFFKSATQFVNKKFHIIALTLKNSFHFHIHNRPSKHCTNKITKSHEKQSQKK